MLNKTAKNGRGRPLKAESTTVKKVGKKRSRGRPLGSKNKFKTTDVGARIERLESVVALLAEILGDVMSKLSSKKVK